jgi:hypothetical protein
MRADRRAAIGGLALFGGHLGLLLVFRLDARPLVTVGLIGVAFIGLWILAGSFSRGAVPRANVILWVALALRLLLLPLSPTLSGDAQRYLWDGKVLLAQQNPYALAPQSEELAPWRDDAWESLAHKDVATVYPPAAMTVFAFAAALPGSFYVLKALLVLSEMVGIALLIALARRRGLPRHRVVWYAWNPLAVIEVAGMGHVDALGVTATIAAVFWLEPGARRVGRAATAAALGILSKLVPLLVLPMWARQSGKPGRMISLAMLVVGAGFLPVLWATGGVPPGLLRYAVSWEFNGPLFEPLWRGLAWIGAPDAVAAVLDRVRDVTGWYDFFNPLYHYRYPQFLAKLILWALLGVAVWRSLARRDSIAATGWLLGWMLLCSATVYPWYLLWILPWAALCRQRPWLVLSASIQLSYLPQLLGTAAWPWYYLAVWLPFALALPRNLKWSTD